MTPNCRHKWSSKITSKAKDSSSTQCLKCGYVRQFVGGIATYFRDDNVFVRYAPKCDNILINNTQNPKKQ